MIHHADSLLIKLRPRPDTIHVAQDRAVLATNPEGWIESASDGLFVHETRMCSKYKIHIGGQRPQRNAISNVKQHSSLAYYVTVPPCSDPAKPDEGSGMMEDVSEHTLELRVSRYVGTGVHEDLDLTNFSEVFSVFELAMELDADFADMAEIHSDRKQRGRIERTWKQNREKRWELDFDYRAEHHYDHQGNKGTARIHRGMTMQFFNFDSEPRFEDGKVLFSVTLKPRASWHTCINWIPRIEGEEFTPKYGCASFWGEKTRYDELRNMFLRESTKFETTAESELSHTVHKTLEQSKEDLIALRLHDLDRGDRAWTMSAGLPIYVALFGRDTLTTSWEAALLGPEMMRGTLPVIAELQGKTENPWRDEQPGRMLHEAHTGPLSTLQFNPRQRYYGAVTTSAFFPVIVSELWHWTGDLEAMHQLLPATLGAFKWLEKYGDLNGDGFHDYQTRSEQGQKNQGWKDSDSAILDAEGKQVDTPIATCEEQGFVYAAKFQFAEVLWWLGKKEEAKRLFHEAEELKKRFIDRFWMESQSFVALAVGKENRLADAITSNPGHCLATGILDQQHAQQVAKRMLGKQLFSGWGVRTLSQENPAFNPYSYHRGSVWPVEHGTFALGLMRYGLIDNMHSLCKAMFEAAALFDFCRLPECFSGHERDENHPFPALYPRANWPQAWSASAVFTMIQALLGLYPYAPVNLLLIDPQLPEWLPSLTLRQLRVGNASVDIRFNRDPTGRSSFEVLEKRGKLKIIRQPSPWSINAGWGERLRDLAESIAS